MRTPEEIRKMTYEELEDAVAEIEYRRRHLKDLREEFLLGNEAHDMRVEMDRRWDELEKREKREQQRKKTKH